VCVCVCVCAVSPVYDAIFVQVLHCRQDLSGVAPHLPLLQPLPLTDPVHQVSSSTELHGHVVAVLCLQSLTQTVIHVHTNETSLFNSSKYDSPNFQSKICICIFVFVYYYFFLPPTGLRCEDVGPSDECEVLSSCSSARMSPAVLFSCQSP